MRLFRTIVLPTCVLCTGCAQITGILPIGGAVVPDLVDAVTIMRDAHGVPHIFGETDAAAAFGIGYAQAEDDFPGLEERYLFALGRASHWYGERYLASDLLQVAFEVERLAQEEYEREPVERRAIWDAFAAGINYYIGTSGVRPRLITRFEPWMPFALARMIPAGTVVDGVVLGVAYDSTARTHPIAERPTRSDAGVLTQDGADAQIHGSAGAALSAASLWAAAPTRTETGAALLLESDIGPFSAGSVPWEFMVRSEDGWHVRGHADPGSPVPTGGHNGRIAWGHSSSGVDGADVYHVRFDHPSDPLMYRFNGSWRRAVEWRDTLIVNTAAGVTQREFIFRRTHHGPVVRTREDTALAVRFMRMNEGGSLQQLLAESRASNIDEFRAALDQRAIAAHVMYADTTGTIYRLLANAVPARDTAFDWTAPVDGTTAATDWTDYLPLSALDETRDPPGGVLHAGRAQRATQRRVGTDSTWTPDGWGAIAFDVWLADAADLIAPLIADWEQIGGRNAARARRLDDEVELLRSWDHEADRSSVEATLFVLWQERLRDGTYAGEHAHFRAMEDVVASLEQEHGGSEVPWGDVNRLWRTPEEQGGDSVAIGVGGAPAWAGGIFVMEAGAGAGPRAATGGTRLVSVVELGSPVRMRTVVPIREIAEESSGPRPYQPDGYLESGLKPALFTRAEVEAAAREVYRPGRR